MIGALAACSVYLTVCLNGAVSEEAKALEKEFLKLEEGVPRIPNLKERSLVFQVDGKTYSAAQLGEWSRRLQPKDEDSSKIAWRFARSKEPAVRYIAVCALLNYRDISYADIPNAISIFDAMKETDSKKFARLMEWVEIRMEEKKISTILNKEKHQ